MAPREVRLCAVQGPVSDRTIHGMIGAGLWETGFGGDVDPRRLIFAGTREVDPLESELIGRCGVTTIPPGTDLRDRVLQALGRDPVFIHIDWDVLESGHIPTEYSVVAGLAPHELCDILAAVAHEREVVGLELAELLAPEDDHSRAAVIACALRIVEPLTASMVCVR
jgi:arginase